MKKMKRIQNISSDFSLCSHFAIVIDFLKTVWHEFIVLDLFVFCTLV